MKIGSLLCLWTSFLVVMSAYCEENEAQCDGGVGVCRNIHPDATTIAIIPCGNSGVGKSFLDNVIVGEEVFVHQYQTSAETRVTESVVANLNGNLVTVYNIPGLIDSTKGNMAKNKIEIEKAFHGKAAVVLFVFGVGDGGRIREEDYTTYLAMNEAYEFHRYSLVFILNNVRHFSSPVDRDEYRSKVLSNLKKLLNWPSHVPFRAVFAENFSDESDFSQSPRIAFFRQELADEIGKCVPHQHLNPRDIELIDESYEKVKVELKSLEDKIESLKAAQQKKLEDLKL